MKIAIFHFNPIEKFPPIMNFIRVLENNLPNKVHIVVFTTRDASSKSLFQSANKRIRIRRICLSGLYVNPLLRYFNYLRYFFTSLLYGLFSAPDKFFYYESVSALVPLLLKMYWLKKAPLYIHYHEYMSEQEYGQTFLTRVVHNLEKKIYPRAAWISHTNPERMRLFLQDIGMPELNNTHSYPNFPLSEWGTLRTPGPAPLPVRLVYVGSFGSMETLYIRETLEWIKDQAGKITLDIYSYNIPAGISDYVNSLDCQWIRVLEQVDYYQLPLILKNYDVGLIIYKGLSKNFEFNAPNKLFEYLVCGLDTWYAAPMKGIWAYDSAVNWPKIIRLDFENLGQYNVEELVYRQAGAQKRMHFTCEDASEELLGKLLYE
ncbi:MAG: hypothetical protein ABI813_09575 [Bacteroidota bacterium]